MTTRFGKAVLLLVFCSLLGGCLTLLGGEARVGAQAARQIEAEMGLVRDPELNAYVRAIGERLVAHSDRADGSWQFQIVDMAEPNAFALPGGFVYVSRGLLAIVNDESELAGVMGHEIGHVTAGHGNKKVTLSAPFTIITGITGWATGIVSPRLGEAVSGAGNTLAEGFVIAPFSRSQERQADRIGADLAARSGWDPAALSRFLDALGQFESLVTGEERRASWLDSHPPSPERSEASLEYSAGLEQAPPNPIAPDRASLFARLDGLVLGSDAGAGVSVGSRFVHPDLGWSLAFPGGWILVNTPAAVASREAEGRAAMVLQFAASGMTLEAFLEENEVEGDDSLSVEREVMNGFPTASVEVEEKRQRIGVTWIEHGGHIYQFAGVSPRKEYPNWRRTFRTSIESFRDASASEISQIRERRLRIAVAESGESLEALLNRVDSVWGPPEASVANGLARDADLEAGHLVKFARMESYAPR